MKAIIVLATAGVAALAIAATPASAYHFSPSGTFTATGTTSATDVSSGQSLPCNASLNGKVNSNGVGSITGGSFTTPGGGPGFCESVQLGNLPWRVVATTAIRLKIKNVQFTTVLGTCGPNVIPASFKNSTAKFTAVPMSGGTGGGCTVSGNLTISPTLTIVP